eukprot:jgi/Mesvir1/16950/Mv15801-RA.1
MEELDSVADEQHGGLTSHSDDIDKERAQVEHSGGQSGEEAEASEGQGAMEDDSMVPEDNGPARPVSDHDDGHGTDGEEEHAAEIEEREEDGGNDQDELEEKNHEESDEEVERRDVDEPEKDEEEVGDGDAAKEVQRAKPGLPYRKPVRHAMQRSAYFIFSSKHRDEIKAELAAAGLPTAVTAVAKALGAKWHALTADEKEAYKPAPEAEDDEGVVEEGAADEEPEHELQVTVFPKTKIKRIAAQDKGVRSISGEATLMLARATELFLESLAESSYAVLKTSNRVTIKVEDLERAISRKRPFKVFLSDSLNDIWKHKEEPAPVSADAEPKAVAAKNLAAATRDAGKGSRPITSFFQKLS